MTYSDKELQQIEQMASLYLPISDIAIVLGINPENQLAENVLKICEFQSLTMNER